MTADIMLLPSPQPLSLPVISCSNEEDALIDFDPLPLDASSNECSQSDFFILSNMFLLNDDSPSLCKSRKRSRRRVSFQDEPIEINVPSFACLAEEERRGLWYRQVEIERFRSTARHACRVLRRNPAAYPADITRGLELRTSLDRQYRKHLALSCILKAQVRYPCIDPLHLAAIANRCTDLPRREAQAQGTRDFCDVYCSTTLDTINNDAFVSTANTAVILPTPVLAKVDFPVVADPQQPCLSPIDNKRLPSVVFCEAFQEAPMSKRQRFLPANDFAPFFDY